MKPKEAHTRSRSPRGLLTKKPIMLRLTASEMDALTAMAERESRSKASMVRLIYLHGLASYKTQMPGQ